MYSKTPLLSGLYPGGPALPEMECFLLDLYTANNVLHDPEYSQACILVGLHYLKWSAFSLVFLVLEALLPLLWLLGNSYIYSTFSTNYMIWRT